MLFFMYSTINKGLHKQCVNYKYDNVKNIVCLTNANFISAYIYVQPNMLKTILHAFSTNIYITKMV
jgi:hypothetical protein